MYDVVFVGVDRPDLDARIAERTQRMWDAGFVDEVRRLAADGLREGRTASRALGYAQILAWLDGVLPERGVGPGGDGAGDVPVRAPAALLVSARSAYPMAIACLTAKAYSPPQGSVQLR